MACYCLRIRCFDCYDYGHVGADCQDKIPPSGVPARHRGNNSHTRRYDRSTSQNNHHDRSHHCDHRDRHRFSRSQSHSTATDTGVTVTVTHEEVTLDPITNPHTAANHATEAQAHTVTDETPHTADPHHAEVFPETAVDLDCIHHTNTHHKTSTRTVFQLQLNNLGKPKTGNISRSPLMIHHPSTIALMNKPATQKMI